MRVQNVCSGATLLHFFPLDAIARFIIYLMKLCILCIDAIGLCALHLAWLRLFHSWLLSQVIKIHYSHVYAHTPQTHYTRQTTRFAQPDRSINHRQNHDERLVIEIITRLQR